MEDTKRLVSSAGGSQEQLAEATQIAVRTITSEADHVKLAAASLGSDDMEAQLLLFIAVKDVANALGDLIGATQSASGKSVQDPSMEQLKTSAKVGKVGWIWEREDWKQFSIFIFMKSFNSRTPAAPQSRSYSHTHPHSHTNSPTHPHTCIHAHAVTPPPPPPPPLHVQTMVAKVSSLLKTVKNVDDEAGRGVRSLKNTIDSIEANIAEFDSPNQPKEPATPEDLIRSTKVS